MGLRRLMQLGNVCPVETAQRPVRKCYRRMWHRMPGTLSVGQVLSSAQGAHALWLALTKDIDCGRPDADAVTLHEAIRKSEGLPCQTAVPQKSPDTADHHRRLCLCRSGWRLARETRSRIAC